MLGFSALRGRRVTVQARAKVNLGLEVLGRRNDGYHELRSLMWAIGLADRVTLEVSRDEISVECDAPGVPGGPENLAWRAADALRRDTGVGIGVRIRIGKKIPVAGGLGGGSADAAAVLVGAARLWGVEMPGARLRALATALGMDVPFFLGPGPALATGRGEDIQAVGAIRGVPLVVVNPDFPLATREVYARLRPEDFGDGGHVAALVRAVQAGTTAFGGHLVNTLERAAVRLWPGLLEVKAALLDAGCEAALMSGSGPTVVGLAPSRRAAARIGAALADRPWRLWVTQTVVGPALSVRDVGGGVRDRRWAGWGVAKR